MKPKIIFWGSPEFSLPSYRACKKQGEVLAVVTQPDRERGRGQDVLPTPVKAAALADGLPVFSPKSLRKVDEETEQLLDFLKNNKADFFVVVAYGNLLPESVLNMPLKACVNIHGSLLPRWRGAAPIQRALEAGDLVTGVCLQKMVKALDAGAVYLEKKCPISVEDSSSSLFQKLSDLGAELMEEFLATPFEQLSKVEQDESKVTLATKIEKAEAYWNKSWTSQQIHNRIRAFNVWPTVKLCFKDKNEKLIEVKVHSSKLSQIQSMAEEYLCERNQSLFLKGSDSVCTELLTLQVPGKAPQAAYQVYQGLKKLGFELVVESGLLK